MCVHACVRVCACACMHVSVGVWMPACLAARMPTYVVPGTGLDHISHL